MRFLYKSDYDAFIQTKFSDFIFCSEQIETEKAETLKNNLISASFTAWQLGAGNGKTFPDHLKALGLGDQENINPESKTKIAKSAIERAEKIKEIDRLTHEKTV